MVTVGERIKQRAESLGITQAEIARMTGITRGSVNQWFNGTNVPKGQNMVSVAKVLRTTPDWILTGKGAVDAAVNAAANLETLRKAAKIIRNAELLSGKPYPLDEFADKLTEIYFRLESNLTLAGILPKAADSVSIMRQASIDAQRIYQKIINKPGIKLTEAEKKQLYSNILDDAYEAATIEKSLNETDVLKAYFKK